MPINKTHAFGTGVTFSDSIDSGVSTENDLDEYNARIAISSFKDSATIGKNCRFGPNAWCANRNQKGKECIHIGDSTICRGIVSCENFGQVNLSIDKEVYIGDDTLISCAENIVIGKHTLIAHGVQIFDNDTHPIQPSSRIADWMILLGKSKALRNNIATAPVFISESVWIGCNSIIMKGVTIGKNSIIAAGSVVTDDIPANVVAAGNPATVIKSLNGLPDNELPLPQYSESYIPVSHGTCHNTHGKGLDSYDPVQVGRKTIEKVVTNPDVLRKVITILKKLETDDYLEYTIDYYLSGLEKLGEDWVYADITTALLGMSRLIKPESYLEIGVRRGRSMAMVASQSPQCHIVGFDVWKANYAGMPNPGPAFVKAEMAKLNYSGNIELISGNSHKTLKSFFQKEPELYFDMITVDGDHTREGAAEDMADVLPRLKIGGIIVFDDIVHPQHTYLLDVWKSFTHDNDRFTTWEFDELGYGVAIAVRRF
jgi:acetyltransferase-like isoleucine patch superfamily enzyme/predicted O-methyltransferase YrrM